MTYAATWTNSNAQGRLEAGVHFIRILGRNPEVEVSFEAVRQYLQGEWLMEQSRKAIRAEVERVRDDYEIVVEPRS